MIKFICLFLPSVIGLGIYKKINKKTNNIDLSVQYLINVLLVNLSSFIFSFYMWNINYNISDILNLYPGFAVKYMFISILFSIIYIFLVVVIGNHTELRIEKNEKKK